MMTLPIFTQSSIAKDNSVNNLEYHVIDQIALEGLDGITLDTLWKNLDDKFPNFNCSSDVKYQNFIWNAIIIKLLRSPFGSGLQAFYLPMEMPDGQMEASTSSNQQGAKSKSSFVLGNSPIKKNSKAAKIDLFMSPVQVGDIRGSCANYNRRSDITGDIIDKYIVTLEQLNSLYDIANVRIVACQRMREKAIIPSWADPNVDLKLREYCLLETIGRSRYEGVAYPNMKSVGRLRIMLMAKGFLTQYQESGNSPIYHLLKRFAPDLASQRQQSAITMSKYLLTKANHTCTLKEFSDEIKKPCEYLRRRFFNYFIDYFLVYTETFVKHSKFSLINESDKILMVKLKKPYTGVTYEEEIARDKAALEKVDALDDGDDNHNLIFEPNHDNQLISLDSSQIMENDSTSNNNPSLHDQTNIQSQNPEFILNDVRTNHITLLPAGLCYHPGKILADRSILSSVYNVIAEASNGLTELDIRRHLNLPKFHLRNHLINLTRLKAIDSTGPSREYRDNPFRIYRASNVQKTNSDQSHKTYHYNQTDIEDTIMEIFTIEQVISEIPVILEHMKKIKPNLPADWSTIKKILKHLVLQGRLRMLSEVVHSVYRERIVHLFCLRSVYKRDPIVLNHLQKLKRTLFAEDRRLHKGKLLPRNPDLQNKIKKGIRKPLRKKKTKIRNYDNSEIPKGVSIFSKPDGIDRYRKASFKGQKRLHPDDTNNVSGPKKKRSRYDAIDTKARVLLGNRRSSFSSEEDSFLLICRITSVLLEPRSRISLCVDKHFVRDLMHREIVESRDKTCDAILRRIKFLRHLPSNFMSVNEWEAELRDDPNIAKFISMDVPVENELKWNSLFLDVLNAVRAKISELLGVSQLNNNKQFLSQSNAESFQAVDNELSQESNHRSQISNMISSNLEFDDITKLLDCYNLQESQSLVNLYRSPFYDRPRNVVDVRMHNVSLVTMAYVLSSYFATNERGEMLRSWLLNKFYHWYPDSLINAVFSKLHQRSMLTRKCPLYQAHMVKPKAKTTHKINKSLLNLMERYLPSSLLSSARPLTSVYKVNTEVANEMFHVALISSAFTAIDLELMVYIPDNVTSIDPESELFKSIEKSKTAEAITRMRKNGTSRMDNSRGALFLLRQHLKRLYPDRILNLSECLVIHPCKMKFQSKEELRSPLDYLERYIEGSKPMDMITEAANLRPNTRRNSNKTSDLRTTLITFIENKRDIGVTDVDINKLVSSHENLLESEVKQELDRLLQDKIVFKVGFSEAIYVHRTYINHWLVTTSLVSNPLDFANELDLERHKRNVKFFPRNWKKIDGTVDVVSLHKHFQSILSYLVISPGITRQSINLLFSNLIPTEHLNELLELMENLGLIRRNSPVAIERPRLFGRTKTIPTKDQETFEPAQDSFVKVCQLLNTFRA